MPRPLFFFLFFLFVAFLIFVAVLSLFWPQKFIKFTAWMYRGDRYSRPNPDWEKGSMWNVRGAGLGLLLMFVWIAIQMLLARHARDLPEVQQVPAPSPSQAQGLFMPLAIGTAVILASIYFFFHPASLIRWIIRGQPHRIFSPDAEKRGASGIRLFVALWFLFGAFIIYVTLKNSPAHLHLSP